VVGGGCNPLQGSGFGTGGTIVERRLCRFLSKALSIKSPLEAGSMNKCRGGEVRCLDRGWRPQSGMREYQKSQQKRKGKKESGRKIKGRTGGTPCLDGGNKRDSVDQSMQAPFGQSMMGGTERVFNRVGEKYNKN